MTEARTGVDPVYLRVAPAEIAHIKFLVESYEGIGIVRTVDRHTAIIVVLGVEDFARDVAAILGELGDRVERVEPPVTDADDWLMREINARLR